MPRSRLKAGAHRRCRRELEPTGRHLSAAEMRTRRDLHDSRELPHGGSLQARMLSTQVVQLYWRYSLEGCNFREPIGVRDRSAPPKKMEPTSRGFSLAARA